jgi:predicted enzyme related to lactoylglutathione lyase
MRSQPLIAVSDVEAAAAGTRDCSAAKARMEGQSTSDWSRTEFWSFSCIGLMLNITMVGLATQRTSPSGNGVLLWFEVDDFDAAVARAVEMKADIFMPRHRNPPTGRGGPNHWECWLYDPEGHAVVLASPHGSAR